MDRQILRYLRSPLSLNQLKQIHALITVNCGSLTSIFTQKLLSVSLTDYARKVFDDIPQPDPRLCSSFIARYSKLSLNRQALDMFVMMHRRCIRINGYTISPVMKSCSALMAVEVGKQIHSLVIHYGLEWNLFVQTALMDFYAKCGDSLTARKLFDEMTERTTVSWNSIISCYAHNDDFDEAMRMFERMQAENYPPNDFTMVTLLSVCAKSGNLEMGMKIGEALENYIESEGFDSNLYVAPTLINMYSKCGQILKALRVFQKAAEKNIVIWTSMITGLAFNGYATEAIALFEDLKGSGVKPNDVTFVALLSACTHAGLVDLGLGFFESMRSTYKLAPKIEHYSCIVDLFCRCGRLNEAYEFIRKMEIEPNSVIWLTLLSACRTHSNVELAEVAFEQLMVLEPKKAVSYELLSNLYANLGRWQDLLKVRRVMWDKGIQRRASCSRVELEDGIHI